MNLGMGEIALLIVLALVLFGPKRLPEMGRAAGKAINEFRSALNGSNSDESKAEATAKTVHEDENDTKRA